MARRRGESDLGTFHRDSVRKGLTYAEAQVQETCSGIGKVRAPKGRLPDGRVYSRISARNGEGGAGHGEKA